MSEKHVMYSPGTGLTSDVMQSIYSFINTHGSTIGMRIASDGGTYATYNGSALGTPDGTAGWWSTAANAYIVIEPVSAMPGGGRAQLKIQRVSTTVLSYVYAPIGGWLTSATTFGSNPVSALTQWNDGTAPGASCNYYLSGGDLSTYQAGSSTYGTFYFRILGRKTANAEDAQFNHGLYFGSYIPREPTLDLQPSCVLARNPILDGSSASWSFATANSSCPNRAPVDDTHTTTDYTNNGHCFVSGYRPGAYNKTRGGKYDNDTLFVHNIAGQYKLGSFDKYTQLSGYLGRSDAGADSAAEYLVVNDLMCRWKPSA